MTMLYLICGKEIDFINREVKRITSSKLSNIDCFNYVVIDAEETSPDDIALECSSIPFGYENKVVVIKRCSFFSESKKKKVDEKLYKFFKEVISNLDDNVDVIFTHNEDNYEQKNELAALIIKLAKIITLKPLVKDDWPKYVAAYFNKKGVSISKDAINELAKRTEGDLSRFHNEANKLMLYTDNVTLTDVCSFIAKPLEENAFMLTEALIKGNIAQAFEIYSDLKTKSHEPVTLISMIGNQFRFINQVKYLFNEGFTEANIASTLKANPYRVRITIKNASKISQARINSVLDNIYNLDFAIKSGRIDRFVGFELFLINFKN